MKERPIIFSGESVRAILDGKKTQTRRVIRTDGYGTDAIVKHSDKGYRIFNELHCSIPFQCPYGRIGDRLWIRETLIRVKLAYVESSWAVYKADSEPVYNARSCTEWQWKRNVLSAIHMPQWASRLTLKIVNVKVERVHEITEGDAISEGIEYQSGVWRDYKLRTLNGCSTARESYMTLWDLLNAKRGYSWASNPWVWVIGFKIIKKEIPCNRRMSV